MSDAMDPARVLRDAPGHLIERSPNQNEQRHRANDLNAWCRTHNIRPTLMQIEQERQRRKENYR